MKESKKSTCSGGKIWAAISGSVGGHHLLLLLTLVILTIAALWSFHVRKLVKGQTDPKQIPFLIHRFLNSNQHKFDALGFRELSKNGVEGALQDANEALPSSYLYPPDQLTVLIQGARDCVFPGNLSFESRILSKALIWHKFLCDKVDTLPTGFFSTRPYMHPNGRSFVALAIDSKRPLFESKDWFNQYRRFLHVSEIPRYFGKFNSPTKQESLIASVGRTGILNMLSGEPIIVADARFYIDEASLFGNKEEKKYFFIPSTEFINFLDRNRLRLTAVEDGAPTCPYNVGRHCLITDSVRLQRDQKRSDLLLAFSGTLAGLVFLGLLIDLYQKRARERIARLFMLKTLTHELRTPAASFRISIEAFRKRFDQFPPDIQDAFLQICEDSQRLRRLIDASSQYLRTDLERRGMAFTIQNVSSINNLLNLLVEPYRDRVSLVLEDKDHSISTDPYWLGICVTNLLENAIQHGIPPIEIFISTKENDLDISVLDRGELKFDKSGKPFSMNTEEKSGLGFGLEITRQILKGLNGRLITASNPTTFTIRLKL